MKITLGNIEKAIIHQVGNKTNGDGVRFSTTESSLENVEKEINSLLKKSFLFEDTYQFYFDPILSLNPIYTFVKDIFKDPISFIEETRNISRYLYEKSVHPKIKKGELCFVYLDNCEIEGQKARAICILKSETKETFLQFHPLEDGYEVTREQGLSLQKLDKGCIIFEIEEDDGYRLSIIGSSKKNEETKYWVDDFLHIRAIKNSFYKTKAVLEMLTGYINNELPSSFDKPKSEQIAYINKGIKELKSSQEIDIKNISERVFDNNDIQRDFKRYSENYQVANHLLLSEPFETEKSAIKKKGQGAMTTIKLDKNFSIQIHDDSKYIEKGFDKDLRMSYYKLYFKSEK